MSYDVWTFYCIIKVFWQTVERHIPVVGTEGQGDDFNPAISDDEDKKEYFDTAEELDRYWLINVATIYHHTL